MTRAPRTRRKLASDVFGGAGAGAALGGLYSLWVVFLNGVSQGAVDAELDTTTLYLGYIGGFGFAGLVGGVIRPWLRTLIGQAFLCFVTATGLYGGVAAANDDTITGHPLKDGLLIATFATPIWVAVWRYQGFFKELEGGDGP